jgi:ABC-2 type transport system permease protein
MREILIIALNDLRAQFRERGTLITMFVVPVIMTVFLGIAISGASAPSGPVPIDVIRTNPADPLAIKFVDLLRTEGGDAFVVCDLADPAKQSKACELDKLTNDTNLRSFAESRLKDTTTLAAVSLPPDFGAKLNAQQSVKIDFIGQGGLNAPQQIQQKVDAVLTRMNGALLAARVVTDRAKPADTQRQSFYDAAYSDAESIWASDPVKFEEQTNSTSAVAASSNGFGQSAPGTGAMFVMINALTLGTLFITERKNQTLQRLLVLPMPRWRILAGKLLGRYMLGLITYAVMITVGTFFKVPWGDWPGVILVVLVYTLAVTALALALATVVKTQQQAAGIALLVSLTLAPLGGAWWPLSIVPPWMQTLGKISPIAWSQAAFNQMIYNGAHLLDILPYVGVLLIFTAVFFVFGVSRFRYE